MRGPHQRYDAYSPGSDENPPHIAAYLGTVRI